MHPLPFVSTIIIHHERSKKKQKKKKRNLLESMRNRDRWFAIDRYFHASNVSIDKNTDRMHGYKKENERNGTESEWNATRDDDARTTTTHGRNDAMAKYYGDIAKAAKGTFAMKTRMDVTRRDAGCDAGRDEGEATRVTRATRRRARRFESRRWRTSMRTGKT